MVCNWLIRRCSKEDEAPEDTARKRVLLPAALIMSCPICVWIVLSLNTVASGLDDELRNEWPLYFTAQCCWLATCAIFLGYAWWTRTLPTWVCEIAAVVGAVGVCVFEVYSLSAFGYSIWFLMIVVLDLTLLIGARQWLISTMVAVALAMIAVGQILRVADVIPAPEWTSDLGVNAAAAVLFGLIFILDYHCTKSFAFSMRQQKAIVEAAIRVSELTAISLSQYEVDEARKIVEGAEGCKLPEALRVAYGLLCRNLTTYKAYLPQSCLPREGGCNVEGGDSSDHSESESPSSTVSEQLRVKPARQQGRRASQARGSLHSVGSHESDITSSAGSSFRQVSEVRVGTQAHARLMEQLRREVTGAQTSEPRSKMLTLLAANRRGTLEAAESGALQSVGELAAALAADVAAFVVDVKQCKGNVDLISGDHRFASFDAVHRCPNHRMAGLRCAWNLIEGGHAGFQHTAAVCCGTTYCGDFGSSEMKRFMIVGGLYCALLSLERIAAHRSIKVLIDNKVYQDASVTWMCKQIDRVYHPKHLKGPFNVWSVVGCPAAQGKVDEWMYELEDREPNPYEMYNKIIASIIKGQFGDAEKLLGAELCPEVGMEQPIRAAYQELQGMLAERRACSGPTYMQVHDVKLELVRADAS
eukprot:TRINITY_DN2151_c0_g1_i5.p1 TRINITY_DN2151_c0_g1~~TRINITY_DN2151_c0_g1_i5.p1  ORF type:complete len:643 (+),score=158.16 TRINITY_DN2151_c0_g1_i5:113-2041(+)